jgi:hypothetical protein
LPKGPRDLLLTVYQDVFIARLISKLQRAASEIFWQLRVPPSEVGFGRGPVTWSRRLRHRWRKRALAITVLEYPQTRLFGDLMVYWINENSLACSARLNRGIESADIVWIMCQDPISSEVRSKLLQALRRKRPEVPIINAPAAYNFYHMPGAFERLACAGMRVPRSAFSSTDIGRTRVVYKKQDMQAAEKFVALYDGERRGFNAFEFCDLKGSDGLYRRYRAHYLAGFVRPSSLMLSPQWNVCLKHMVRQEFSFQMSVFEKDQVRRIAAESALDFFAVDYVMDPDQGMPVFTGHKCLSQSSRAAQAGGSFARTARCLAHL